MIFKMEQWDPSTGVSRQIWQTKERRYVPGATQCGSLGLSQLQSAWGRVKESYISPDILHELAIDIPHCIGIS